MQCTLAFTCSVQVSIQTLRKAYEFQPLSQHSPIIVCEKPATCYNKMKGKSMFVDGMGKGKERLERKKNEQETVRERDRQTSTVAAAGF